MSEQCACFVPRDVIIALEEGTSLRLRPRPSHSHSLSLYVFVSIRPTGTLLPSERTFSLCCPSSAATAAAFNNAHTAHAAARLLSFLSPPAGPNFLPPLFALHSHFTRMEWKLWNREREKKRKGPPLHGRRPPPPSATQSAPTFPISCSIGLGKCGGRRRLHARVSLPPLKIHQLSILFAPSAVSRPPAC